LALYLPVELVNVGSLERRPRQNVGDWENDAGRFLTQVIHISEVTPSRGVKALEGEGRALSHLEVIARGVVLAPASQ
jgi:hypothetical protein